MTTTLDPLWVKLVKIPQHITRNLTIGNSQVETCDNFLPYWSTILSQDDLGTTSDDLGSLGSDSSMKGIGGFHRSFLSWS